MDSGFYIKTCEVDFCFSTHNFPQTSPGMLWYCKLHQEVMHLDPDWDVVADPDTGDDKYLLDGLTYRFRLVGPEGFSMQATGSFDCHKSNKGSLVFHLKDYEEFAIIPRDGRFRFVDISAY